VREAKKILIIDDEPDTVTFLRTYLEDNGYGTRAASDGKAGLEALLKERPDAVILDVNMPSRTGVQLYREMSQHEGLHGVPVIFITGLSEFQIFGRDCSPLPAPVACLEKPIDLPALLEAVRRAVGGAE
jgi:CheY-like chemotaxis protein